MCEESVLEVNVNKLLIYLLNGRKAVGISDYLDIKEKEAFLVAKTAQKIFEKEQICEQVNHDVIIVGDIHGQYDDLLRIFDRYGYPPRRMYVFLGDYVDRGIFSLEVIVLLFLLKIKHPDKLLLLRGNHETKSASAVYGFRKDIKKRFGNDKLWRTFCEAFSEMPVCAVVAQSILCCHGGITAKFLSPKIRASQKAFIDYINNRKRPYVMRQGTELFDMLWADPEYPEKRPSHMFKSGNRGCTITYSGKAVRAFTRKYKFQKIIRAHQVFHRGYMLYGRDRLITIFSAPGYLGEANNYGAVGSVTVSHVPRHNRYKAEIKIDQIAPSEKHMKNSSLWYTSEEFQEAADSDSVFEITKEENP